jgi:hypothetical protein
MLAKNVELTLEVLFVEFAVLAFLRVGAVSGLEDYERLKDDRFARESSGTENGVVGRDVSPTENSKVEFIGNFGESLLLSLELSVVSPVGTFGFAEEDVSDGVLPFFREFDTDFTFSLSNEESVRKSDHDSSSVSVSRIGTGSTSVSHVA